MAKIFGLRLRPEINKPIYWLHIVLIALILLAILKFVFNHDMFTFEMVWKVSLTLAFADIAVHTVLKLD